MKALYKYPRTEYPYAELVEENSRRTNRDPEYEIDDTGRLLCFDYLSMFSWMLNENCLKKTDNSSRQR